MVAQGSTGSMAPGSKGLAQGDLRLVALALIAEAPRHGYEIIKLIEQSRSPFSARGSFT